MLSLPEFLGDGASQIAAVAVAIALFLLFVKARLNFGKLPVLRAGPATKSADCMVVIPARDEEDVIERAVKSLPHDSVIVVDDASSDQTAKRAREAGAGVLPAPALPRGGAGKANACAAGAAPLTSRWILFADADTWFEPGFLEAAVGSCEASGLFFLSIYAEPVSESFLEHLLTPYLRALYFAGTNPKANPAEAFSGQIVLARRETYQFLGGHNAVLRDAVDDIRMARLFERHRVTYGLAKAPRLCHVRMYRGARGIWSGLERQAVRYHLASPVRAIMGLLAAGVALLWLPVLVGLLYDRLWMDAALFALVPVILLRPWYPSPWRTLWAPIAFYLAIPFLFHATLAGVTGRQVTWKGRQL
jgi:glycosyltransferase involved in cell wall biosynthesis